MCDIASVAVYYLGQFKTGFFTADTYYGYSLISVCDVFVSYCRILCNMFIVWVLVLDRLSQCRIESTGIVGTRTVPVPGNGEPNIQGARTRTVPVPGSGKPNIQGARTSTEQVQFLFQEVGNQMYKLLKQLDRNQLELFWEDR